MWTGGLALALLYLRAKGEYRMTKAAAAFFFCSPFLFAAPLAAELYRSGWQPAALIDALVPSATGLAAGFAVSFASAVLACVISRLLPFKIPFLRLTVVLSALYYTDCCFF
ncbi:MAG: hypothetical protein Q4D58_03940 [Synergistaceae bacterium]|nr:hypothetical protein [Synergistaceae bacterium]